MITTGFGSFESNPLIKIKFQSKYQNGNNSHLLYQFAKSPPKITSQSRTTAHSQGPISRQFSATSGSPLEAMLVHSHPAVPGASKLFD